MFDSIRSKLKMFNSIRSKTIILFLLFSGIPLLTSRLVGFPIIQKALQEAGIRDLEGVGHKQAELVSVWMKERKAHVTVMAREHLISSFLRFNPGDKEYQELTSQLQSIRDNFGYKEISLTDDQGRIRVSTGEDLLGLSIAEFDYFQEALKGNIFVTRIHPSAFPIQNESGEMERGVPTLFVSGPVRDDRHRIIGVVSLRVDVGTLSKEMRRVKLGETGETYLVDENGYMITESRFASTIREMGLIKKRTALELRLVDPTTGQLTRGVQACLKGESGYDAEGYPDYRGVKVLGFWHWIPEYNWGLMSEIDEEEAYRDLYELDRALMSIAFALLAVIVAVAVFLGRRFTAPILYLTEATRRMSGGDLHQRAVISSRDEIGLLAESFNTMAETIEDNVKEIESSRNLVYEVLGGIGCLVRIVNPKAHTVSFQNKPLQAVFPQGLSSPCYTLLGRDKECDRCTSIEAVEKDGDFSKEEKGPGGKVYEIHSFPLANPDGTVTSAIEVIKDITDHKKMEGDLEESRMRLLESQKLATVGHLSTGIAHYLHNPLTGINLSVEVLIKKLGQLRDGPVLEECKSHLAHVKVASRRCEEVVKDLLKISNIPKPKKSPTDLNEAVEHVLGVISPQMVVSRVQLVKELSTAVPKILGSHSQLETVFMNFISNALDAMPKGGTLTVTTRDIPGEDKVEATIMDTGEGILNEELSHVFDPYVVFKIRPATRCTGLELPLAQLIILLHGGTVGVDSEIGKGTTFKVRLPVCQEEKVLPVLK